jgi:hypothetical protein
MVTASALRLGSCGTKPSYFWCLCRCNGGSSIDAQLKLINLLAIELCLSKSGAE